MEWSLVFLDVGWDATSVLDFANVTFSVIVRPDDGTTASTAGDRKKQR